MRRPLVQAGGDPRCVPAQQRQDDERDHREDEVGLAEVRAVEARGAHDLADPECGRDSREHREHEHVDERHEPARAPSHGNDQLRSTAEIIAITIVGNRTRKPQKIAACIAPGNMRWNSLRWPSTITASFLTRCGTSSYRSTGFPARTRRTSSNARRAKSAPATATSAVSASAPANVVMPSGPF